MHRGLYFGKEIKQLRTQSGLSQQEVADTYQYDRTTISAFELDKLQTPDEFIIKFAVDQEDTETIGEFFKQKGLELFDTLQKALKNKAIQMIQISDVNKPFLMT